MAINIDRDYLINTLTDLVRINSVNPTLVEDGKGEQEIANYIVQSLKNMDLDIAIHEPEPGRISVVGKRRGNGGGRSLMLNGHIDTVGIEDMDDPFNPTISDGKMYGRGTYDMKGSVAACMTAMKALVDAGKPLGGDLLIAAVADEEYASIGTADLVNHYKMDGAVVAEPSELEICLAHKGFIWLEVEVIGRAAHGSRYDLGIDANIRMGRFLAKLDELAQKLQKGTKHPLVGPPTLHAATIQGGTGLSTYAAHCKLQIERRTIPGETQEQVVDNVQSIITRLTREDPTFKATLKTIFVRDPFEVSPDAAIVKAISEATTNVRGAEPQHSGQNPWMDSAILSAAGVETVVMGPIGAGAHSREEWVDIQSLVDLAQILAETAINYCR